MATFTKRQARGKIVWGAQIRRKGHATCAIRRVVYLVQLRLYVMGLPSLGVGVPSSCIALA